MAYERLSDYHPPSEENRPDGLEVLAFHRGKWVHVKWSATHRGWSLGYGGALIKDEGRQFFPLPPKPDGALGFYDYRKSS
jgi:hypothetical protein